MEGGSYSGFLEFREVSQTKSIHFNIFIPMEGRGESDLGFLEFRKVSQTKSTHFNLLYSYFILQKYKITISSRILKRQKVYVRPEDFTPFEEN